jgi:hypothetical protein
MKFNVRVIPIWAKLLAFVLWTLLAVFIGVRIGANGEKAKELNDANKATKQLGKRDDLVSDVSTKTRAEGNAAQATTQGATHDTQERVRTIYRNVTVAADCRQPDGVLNEIRAAGERANSSVSAASGAAAVPVSRRW